MKMRSWFVILIFTIATLIATLTLGATETNTISPKAINGVLDLSEWNFRRDGVVSLKGEWTFYRDVFIYDSQESKKLATTATTITIPSTKNSIENNPDIEGTKFSGSMVLNINLPADHEIYGLRSDIVLTAYDLFVSGNYQSGAGIVGKTRAVSRPQYTVKYVYFKPESQTLEIVYHVSDYYNGDGFIATPKFGLADEIATLSRDNIGRDMFLFGMLVIMGIYHLILFSFRRKDKATLFFAIFCLAFSLRMLLVGERFIPTTFDIAYGLLAKVAYMTVYIGIPALCGFLYHALEGLYFKHFDRWTMAIGLLFSAMVFVIPYELYDTMLMVYGIFFGGAMIYLLVRLFYGVWKQMDFAHVILFGFISLGITFANDFVYQFTGATITSTIPIGLSIFTLTQTYALTARITSAFRSVERLSGENETILMELRDVNSNLEMMVEERTSDLKEALQEVHAMSRTDYLTKLPNRRHMANIINKMIDDSNEFCIGILDIDHFKRLNDTYGHTTGDEVLIHIADIMRKVMEGHGYAARWGGEEFLLLFKSSNIDEAYEIAEELRTLIEMESIAGLKIPCTVTIGLYQYLGHEEIDTCVAKADKALYSGKVNGRNQSQVFV